jgi:SAM-dependent methyltransferase
MLPSLWNGASSRVRSYARHLRMNGAQRRASRLRTRYDRGAASAEEIAAELEKYEFYHNLEVAPGLSTKGTQWADNYVRAVAEILEGLPIKGKRVLDIGCRDGAHMFHAESLGAAEVIGIDNNPSRGLTNFLLPFKRSAAKAYALNLYDLSASTFGTFDVVIFAGVLYHLRYPVWALRRIADILSPRGILLIEGGFIEAFGDLPVLFCPIGSDSPFEPSSVTFFNQAGLTDTLLSIGFSKIKLRKTYLPAFEPAGELAFIKQRFPDYLAEFGDKASLGLCRKIFTCRKQWDKKESRLVPDPLTGGTPKQILRNYWDGLHGRHTRKIKRLKTAPG